MLGEYLYILNRSVLANLQLPNVANQVWLQLFGFQMFSIFLQFSLQFSVPALHFMRCGMKETRRLFSQSASHMRISGKDEHCNA